MTAFSVFLLGLLLLALGVVVNWWWLVRVGAGVIAVATVLSLLS
ncbi:hypothetical protein [Chromobacterium vaccinii]